MREMGKFPPSHQSKTQGHSNSECYEIYQPVALVGFAPFWNAKTTIYGLFLEFVK
jgi:hypothetical protein